MPGRAPTLDSKWIIPNERYITKTKLRSEHKKSDQLSIKTINYNWKVRKIRKKDVQSNYEFNHVQEGSRIHVKYEVNFWFFLEKKCHSSSDQVYDMGNTIASVWSHFGRSKVMARFSSAHTITVLVKPLKIRSIRSVDFWPGTREKCNLFCYNQCLYYHSLYLPNSRVILVERTMDQTRTQWSDHPWFRSWKKFIFSN